jgi:uncharacterized protein
LKKAPTQKDIIFLEDFLLSDKTPTKCMNLFSLDGFLTCLVIGPGTILPSKWLPEIWGETETDEMTWDSMDETENIIGLIMRYNNMKASAIQRNSKNSKPLMFERTATQNEGWHIEDWCHGFVAGINLAYDEWQPLMESEEDSSLIAPLYLFTSEVGRKNLEQDEEFSSYTRENWEVAFNLVISEIHEFWLPHRDEMHVVTHQALSKKIGRNEPCICGSGKKYKNCCLN